MIAFAVATILSAPPPVAVVGLGDTSADAVERVRVAEPNAIPLEAMWKSLTGTDDPRTPSADSLQRMLDDARDREARFDSAGAEELRAEIARAFARSIRPSDAVRSVAARAAHDTAAALLASGDEPGALRAAVTAVRAFPDATLDATRHPPPVLALFERAHAEVTGEPHGRLRVEVDAPGAVIVDGANLGETEDAIVRELPAGSHRIWWAGADGSRSLAHHVELTDTGATVAIPAQLERRIRIRPSLNVECDDDCASLLKPLGQRLGAARVIGVRGGGRGVVVDVATGTSTPWPATDPLALSARPRFSAWYLVPFGVGQFAQDRPVFGSVYAAGQAGLLVWHLLAWKRHSDAVADGDFGREPDLRSQRNLSAGLFYGALAATVAEALIVGWVTGE